LAEAGEKLGPTETELLQKSISAANRLDRLIRDVLIYSRVSREAVELSTLDVEQLLRQIIDERPEFQPPKAEIEIQSPLEKVRGHEAYLTQCITNLLGNGVKFVAPNTQPRIRIWSEVFDHQVRLWFEDNGIGIAREAQERVFGIFQRIHAEKTYPGTGIGLAIVRKAVERMGGRAGVESEPGRGSRFWLQLPRGE
jgi:signal transduction histidine kinase